MSLQFINRPVFTERSAYDDALLNVVSTLTAASGIKSVYRFGNITTPGISDIDILAVFENDAKCNLTGFENLKDNRSLFTHGIMALCEKHFYQNTHYALWSDYIYLSGVNINQNEVDVKSEEEHQALKVQTALEFIIANYIDIKIQLTYRTVKLRSLLQHMKGLIYDLEYLGIYNGELYDMLLELRHWSLNWFAIKPSDRKLQEWIIAFDKQFEKFCTQLFLSYSVYLPEKSSYAISKNATLYHAKSQGYTHSGLLLPALISNLSKKYFNLQNKLNSFSFYFPVTHASPHPIVEERFNFLVEMKAYNKRHLPQFMTITTSILSKII